MVEIHTLRKKMESIVHKIKYINNGLGCLIGDTIYLNKKLIKVSKIHNRILEHELEHVKGNHSIDKETGFDFEIFKFIINEPSTWTHFLPVWYIDKTIAINRRWSIIWTISIIWIIFIIWCLSWMT